jgi:hypothetical protein
MAEKKESGSERASAPKRADTAREGVFDEEERSREGKPSSPSGLGSSRSEDEQQGRLDTESRGIGRTFIGQTEARGAGGERGERSETERARGDAAGAAYDVERGGKARGGAFDEERGDRAPVGAGRTARDAEGR